MISTEPTAAIMPPIRQLIVCGLTLEKSNAGEMKLATMLMPMVAIVKVKAPKTMAKVLSIWATVVHRIGDAARRTPGTVSDAVTTTSSENTRKLTGRPRKLPFFTAAKLLAVAGEVTEVEHRAGEVGHHQRDRAEHDWTESNCPCT